MKKFAKITTALMCLAAMTGCAIKASSEYRLDVNVEEDTHTAVCEIVKKRSGETLRESIADTASFSPTGARIVLQYDGTVDHDGDGKADKKITLPDSTHQYDLEIEEKEDGGYGYADEDILTEAGFELVEGFNEYTVGDYLYSSNFEFHFGDYLTDDLTKLTLQLGRYHGFVKSDDLAWDYIIEKDEPVVESSEDESKSEEAKSEGIASEEPTPEPDEGTSEIIESADGSTEETESSETEEKEESKEEEIPDPEEPEESEVPAESGI